jgi:hypothetical protein
MPDSSRDGTGPGNGSSDKNRTAAGIPRGSSARQQYSSDSIDAPIQTLGSGHGLKAFQLATRVCTSSRRGLVSGTASSADNCSISAQTASTNFCDSSR